MASALDRTDTSTTLSNPLVTLHLLSPPPSPSHSPPITHLFTLLSLPPELISHLVSFLPLPSLTSLSLVSLSLHSLVQPSLYHSYVIGTHAYDEDGEKERVREGLRMLAEGDHEPVEEEVGEGDVGSGGGGGTRRACVRRLEVRGYSWFEEREVEWLVKIVKGARMLESVSLIQQDNASATYSYVSHFPPFWSSLKTLPRLTHLTTTFGPNGALHLEEFPSLQCLSMSEYRIDEEDGTLPKGLKELTLDYVAVRLGWFGDGDGEEGQTWKGLKKLRLIDMNQENVEVICDSLTSYHSNSLSLPSPLTHLTLHLYPRNFSRLPPQTFLHLLNTTSFLPSLTHLRIESTDELRTHPGDPFPTWVGEVFNGEGYKKLENLYVYFGVKRPSVLELGVEDLNNFLDSFSSLQSLTHLQTNITPRTRTRSSSTNTLASHLLLNKAFSSLKRLEGIRFVEPGLGEDEIGEEGRGRGRGGEVVRWVEGRRLREGGEGRGTGTGGGEREWELVERR